MTNVTLVPGGICTTDPIFSEDYWCWTFNNGTTVYCNVTYVCLTSFEADPDIAGIGVLIGFVLAAILTVVTASISAVHPAAEALRSYCKRHNQRLPSVFDGRLNSQATLRLQLISQRLLDALCDLQIITGTGIVVSGLPQYRSINFYHQQLVVGYWSLTLNSFWAARSSLNRGEAAVEETDKRWSRGRSLVRGVAILCNVILFAAFNGWVAVRQYYGWDPWTSGRCYISHDHSAYGSVWLWQAGLCLQIVGQSMSLFEPTESLLDRFFQVLENANSSLASRCRDMLWTVCQKPPGTWNITLVITSATEAVCLFVLLLWLLIQWSFTQFLAIWAWGVAFYPIEVCVYIAFAAWTTYDILDLKLSNTQFLMGSETAWGFGQVLPLVLIASLAFNAFDALRPSGLPPKAKQATAAHWWRQHGT